MIRIALLTLSLLGNFLFAEEKDHKFAGKHFVASYLDCDLKAIANVDELIRAMDEAVHLSGATILNEAHHIFPPNGLTLVYLLSESHSSLHTYPEYGACFVDLFTCGDHCSSEKFDEALRAYLKPQTVNSRLFIRHEGIEEIVYSGQPCEKLH
ncbi:MAG TPA: adenosylmethionine decarboxylase [Chlamydiales bacterium]|nr:adenosylmethionine decarboxylase [Chlamydiales bacterium]